jgi:hypothetical protein
MHKHRQWSFVESTTPEGKVRLMEAGYTIDDARAMIEVLRATQNGIEDLKLKPVGPFDTLDSVRKSYGNLVEVRKGQPMKVFKVE